MKTSIPRISSVKSKNGGAKLYIFENRTPKVLCQSMTTMVGEITDRRQSDMAGYAIVAWGNNGGLSTGVHIEDGRWCNQIEMPEMVKLALQDHIAGNR